MIGSIKSETLKVNGIVEEYIVTSGGNVNVGDFVKFVNNSDSLNDKSTINQINSSDDLIIGIAKTSGKENEKIEVYVPDIESYKYINKENVLYNTDPASIVPYGYLSNTIYNHTLHIFVNDNALELRISNINAIKVKDGYYIEKNGKYIVGLYLKGRTKPLQTYTINIDINVPKYQINDDFTLTVISGISKVVVENGDSEDEDNKITYEGESLNQPLSLPYEYNYIKIYDLNGELYTVNDVVR